MRIAEALAQRADIQRRIQDLQSRLAGNVLVQEGESPAEDPQALLAEMDRSFDQLQSLIARINRSNLQTALPNGASLTAALAQRDVLKLRFGALKSVAHAASVPVSSFRYSRAEIKTVPTVSVAELQRQADRYAQDLRELDVIIQEVNWTTDLVD